MAENKQDVVARAYARLQVLRKNIDQINYGVSETYVHEFHAVLSKLENVGIDVSEFRVPDSLVKPKVTCSYLDDAGKSKHSYSEEKYVEKALILTKLDAILGYFEITMSEKPKNIGFRTSKD